ncbi:ABC transporter substrate-binding protein [Leucobacter albus]|uniref:ABC transporter substrate-binding protein n=1 Tax=Leucobacter albus TaxID=272210 RepID=A0ABW3TT43_9MICO
MSFKTAVAAGAVAALSLVALAGCSPAASPEPAAAPAKTAEADFPRTVEIPAGRGGEARSLTVAAEPQAIAALDYESAEVLAELGLADRLVLVPEAVLNPALGGHVDEMEQVPATFPVAMNLDTETVISTGPDLVVMSPRHGAEDTIGAVLEQAGLTTLQLPSSWTDPAMLTQNIALIGETTGTEPAAAALVSEIESGLADNAASTAGADTSDAPRVLVLTNQAGRPFATAGSAFPLHLLNLAGAVSVSDELGMTATGPISAEQIVQAAPDGIVLIDMNGTGDRMYAELLANPAVATVPAAADDKLLRVSGRDVQALGLAATGPGLAELTQWVATLQ